jgi:hypothetical protein
MKLSLIITQVRPSEWILTLNPDDTGERLYALGPNEGGRSHRSGAVRWRIMACRRRPHLVPGAEHVQRFGLQMEWA